MFTQKHRQLRHKSRRFERALTSLMSSSRTYDALIRRLCGSLLLRGSPLMTAPNIIGRHRDRRLICPRVYRMIGVLVLVIMIGLSWVP